MSSKRAFIEGAACVVAVAAAAGTATGLVKAAAGSTRGAPGITKALSTLGQYAGGGMISGLALLGGSAGLVSLTVYRTLALLDA